MISCFVLNVMIVRTIGALNHIIVSALISKKRILVVVEMGRLTHIAGGVFVE